tara:strand:+ start:167 stop:658 length:492 start_codon:yes stop_codon:yes gene_type:complete
MNEEFKKINNIVNFSLFHGDKQTRIYAFMIYKSFEGSFSFSQQQVSEKLGISRIYVNNSIKNFINMGLFTKDVLIDARGKFNSYEISKIIEHNEINEKLVNNSLQASKQSFTEPKNVNNNLQASKPEITQELTTDNTLNKSINTSEYLKEIKKKKDEKKRKRK